MSTVCCSNQHKRRHEELQSSDADGGSDSSFLPVSPLSLDQKDGKKKHSIQNNKAIIHASIVSMSYPIVKFKFPCRHPYQQLHKFKESMIGQITRKFVTLIKSRGGFLSVEDASQTMQVTRRRLYDVLHVLEGAGLVQRYRPEGRDCRTAIIQWLPLSRSYQKELQEQELEKLRQQHQEEAQLDKWIVQLSVCPTENASFMYATRQDLLSHNHRKGHVDLIVSSPRGSQLQCIGGTSLRIIPGSHNTDCGSKAFVLEDNGKLQPLDHLTEPTPLLARCCSDFSVQALKTS